MLKIAIDLMGGDYAPRTVVEGIAGYLQNPNPQVHFLLIGQEECKHLLTDFPVSVYTFIAAPEVIGMNEHPVRALREKEKSSVNVGFYMLKNREADAFIGAGNTGAMLVGATYHTKIIPGVLRPVIAAPIPRCADNDITGTNILLDVGLNADCKVEYLNQFALLGSLYAEAIFEKKKPAVGLLNIGEEEGKGNILVQNAFKLLKENPYIRFIGNIEGRYVCMDKADVIVCDGFVGNIVLKQAESFHTLANLRGVHDAFIDRCNYETYGGTPILGIDKPVIIGHGISGRLAFKNMILLAEKICTSTLLKTITDRFQHFL